MNFPSPKKIALLLPLILGACATLDAIEQQQQENRRLLEQQASHIAMQEEQLAQLLRQQRQQLKMLEKINSLLLPEQTLVDDTGSDTVITNTLTVTELVDVNEQKQVLGHVEWVWVELLKRNLKARVDTGAATSSLTAIDVQLFERDGQQWVRFRVPDEEHPEGGDLYETPLVKHVKIRQASAEGLDRRPVIQIAMRVGDTVSETEVTLTNREEMLYPLLLGRNFLRDIYRVDVAMKFTQGKYVIEPQAPELQP